VTLAEGRGVVALFREITREREALRAKDALFAVVGHELRNPLTSIHGYSQMMSRQLGIVQQQVDQLGRLLADFMAASALESGELPLSRERLDLADLARSAADRFRGAHEKRTLRLELGDAAPIAGDPARLAQVIDNLLGNAAKYSPLDQEIVLAVRQEGEAAVLEVRDRGVGIAPEHLPHLFDRFYRAPGPGTEQVKGLGLGLAIARDLIAAHGGEITAESAGLGQGSTFRVRLPLASEPSQRREPALTTAPASAGDDTRPRRLSRVLGSPVDRER
jgi:signal transduction histidine kinase